jgi:hypothetical protein
VGSVDGRNIRENGKNIHRSAAETDHLTAGILAIGVAAVVERLSRETGRRLRGIGQPRKRRRDSRPATPNRQFPKRPAWPMMCNEIVGRYLTAVGNPREVVKDPEARYFGGRLEERSLVALGGARLGRLNLEEWLCHSRKGA